MEHLARIPKDRIAVLIGKRGSTRKMIENVSVEHLLHIESPLVMLALFGLMKE